MKAVEIYNMKINMGLVDLQKYYDLVNQIKNIPNSYIEIFDLQKIADEIKEELKIEIKRDVDELIDLYSKLVLNLHLKLGNELSELEFKLNQIKIQSKLNALQKPKQQGFSLNQSLEFKSLNSEILNLITLE